MQFDLALIPSLAATHENHDDLWFCRGAKQQTQCVKEQQAFQLSVLTTLIPRAPYRCVCGCVCVWIGKVSIVSVYPCTRVRARTLCVPERG